MLEMFFQVEAWGSLVIGLILLAFGVAKRKPSLISLGALAFVQLGLVVQLISSIAMVAGGARAKGDTIEFFAYILVALLVPLGAAFWALIERTRWSTFVLGVGSLTVSIMLARMHQIWFG
jgi:hydrogenase-4 membrane subunit HyfE